MTDPSPSQPPSSQPENPPGTPAEASGPPPSHAGWAVASLLFFWPLSFSAFTHAFNVYPLWSRGDLAGAREASARVRRLGQLSLWLGGSLLLAVVVLYTVLAVIVIAGGDHGYHHHGRYMDHGVVEQHGDSGRHEGNR